MDPAMASQVPISGSSSALPTVSAFSFSSPFVPSTSFEPTLNPATSTPASPPSLKPQRRVSLALPSSPRQFPSWAFRDDTTVGVGNASNGSGVSERRGKMRRICDDGDVPELRKWCEPSVAPTTSALPPSLLSPPSLGETSSRAGHSSSSTKPVTSSDPPKKPRKKWSTEETQMLVNGCNKWGVGNWKSILNDPELTFDNRSPVDLKDRFRTYFPDAYKIHYPNARTHLPSSTASQSRTSASAKSRSLLPDGSPLFLASRQKKRRPFTAEEDRALKEGYDKHGTVWATIVKDPVFKEQGRRSTDLRDRFRNAWPDLYTQAGYKPRANPGKKKKTEVEVALQPMEKQESSESVESTQRPPSEPSSATVSSTPGASTPSVNSSPSLPERGRTQPVRAATDDQIPTTSSCSGPIRRKRRHTTHGFGLYRGGTKSVPESISNSEDERSDNEDEKATSMFKGLSFGDLQKGTLPSSSAGSISTGESTDVDMDTGTFDLGIPDFSSSSSLSMSDLTDSSSLAHLSWPDPGTPLHPWTPSVPTTTANVPSTTPNQNPSNSSNASAAYADSLAASPTPSSDYFLSQSPASHYSSTGMIGKSAWGPDWMSPNPRLGSNGDSTLTGGVYSSPLGSPSLYPSHTHPLSLAQLSFAHLTSPPTSGSQGAQYSNYSHFHSHSQAYTHGVLDRYDLFPTMSHSLHHGTDDFDIDTLDLDFISEGVDPSNSDIHSAFSDPSAWTGTGPRVGGITHHSNYAGDLIFGARTHQPTGHRMEYGLFGGLGVGGDGLGLGLEGLQAPSVLHTPALPGIDEIELTNISLDDPLDSVQDVDMGVEPSVDPLSSSRDSSGASANADDQYPTLCLEDIVGIPPGSGDPQEGSQDVIIADVQDTSNHITPPATPAAPYRISARASGGYGAQHRSVSVPPSEHKAFLPPRRPGQSQMASPNAKYKSLVRTPTRATFAVPLPPTVISTSVSAPLPAPAISIDSAATPPRSTSSASAWPPTDPENDLPFLDLHYYTNGTDYISPQAFSNGSSMQLGAQALDLARTTSAMAGGNASKPLCIAPSLVQPNPLHLGMDGMRQSRLPAMHQRGQSTTAVSPQDLLLHKGNDNKRKRASWDGGPR